MTEGGGSYPRRSAVTRRFTLGQPRNFAVAGDGSRVVFVRSAAGDDPVNSLWAFDLGDASERLVVDARDVLSGAEDLSVIERARRERARESAEGIVAYGADPLLRVAAFALSGRLFVADLLGDGAREIPALGPVFDPRADPTGRRVAYATDRALRVVELDAEHGGDREVAAEDDPNVSWGIAEFVAAEEMGRSRGFWWSPDGSMLLAARVDLAPVRHWYIADPAEPSRPPYAISYPAAGTPNALVTLALFGLPEASRVDVEWDREALPYLVTVAWSVGHPPVLLVGSRDQRRTEVLAVDVTTGSTSTLREDRDPVWLEIVPGVPAWTAAGGLVVAADLDDTRRLLVDGAPVTPPGLHVRHLVDAGESVVFAASGEPTEQHIWRVTPGEEPERVTVQPGMHDAAAGGNVLVLSSASMEWSGSFTTVVVGGRRLGEIASHAERPQIEPRVTFLRSGSRELRTAVLLPAGHHDGDGPYPVLMDPYGGPHAQRVVKARDVFLPSQWMADQGFAVVVADGRGTPGRGTAWEQAVHLDLAAPVLEDQVDALRAVADAMPGTLDLGRVAIRGWSFGGYLAALAVLRRPDVFHAAVAGSPVTDWHLYDTHYTERYLGHPDERPEAYERSSVLAEAARLERPLMLVHGLADDNVVVAHTLKFSSALLAAGRPHTVLPLSGVTHMTPQEVVAENLLLLQVAFLRDALGLSRA